MVDNKDLYSSLAKWLYAILYTKSHNFFEKENSYFIDLVEKEINILNIFENKYSNDVDLGKNFLVTNLVEKYNLLTQKKFALKKIEAKNDFDSLIDEANYLKIYCKNVYKVDLNQLYKDIVSPKKVISNPPPLNENVNSQSNFDFFNSLNNIFFNKKISSLTKAQAKILKDISLGKIYIYDSKPKCMPILKNISFIFTILTILSFVFLIALLFLIDGTHIDGDFVSTKFNIFFHIFQLLIIIFTTKTIFKSIFNPKNENFKYYFHWKPMLTTNLLFFILLLLNYSSMITFLYFNSFSSLYTNNTNLQVYAIKMFYYNWYVLLCLIALNIVLIGFSAYYNPKKNKTVIDNAINKYLEEISHNNSN